MTLRRYQQFAETVTADGTTYLSGLPFVDLLYTGRTVYHEVSSTEVGRLDLITYKYLGDTSLWWYVALYNGIMDPIGQVTQGLQLAIPIDAITTSEVEPFTYSDD